MAFAQHPFIRGFICERVCARVCVSEQLSRKPVFESIIIHSMASAQNSRKTRAYEHTHQLKCTHIHTHTKPLVDF